MAALTTYGALAEIGEEDARQAIQTARSTAEPAHIGVLLIAAQAQGGAYQDGVHHALALAAMGRTAEADAPA